MKTTMKLFWCNIDNFGDALNRYIYKKCFGVEAVFADSWDAEAFGIGSILEKSFWQTKDYSKIYKKFYTKPVDILSSGLGRDLDYYKKKPRFLYNTFLKRKLNIISLRGELTKKSMEIILEQSLDNIMLGDLGILSSYLTDNIDEKIYDIGICPHYSEQDFDIFKQIKANNPNSIILNTKEDPIEFLNKLRQCRAVISTGLHPLIAADSLGIPNMWCEIYKDKLPRFKFYDYYSIYGIKPEPVSINEPGINSEMVINNYKVDKNLVSEIKQNLFVGYKKYFNSI